MADDDIDTLLEAGLKAARKASTKESHINLSDPAHDDNVYKRSRSHSRSSRSKRSRRSSLSRSHRSSRRSSRSKSRSRSSRRHSHSSRRNRRESRRSSRSSRSRSHSRSRRRSRSNSDRSDTKKDSSKRARSTSAERAEKAKQRELMELTRDHRTVFVGQLTQKVRERDLKKFFSQFGKIETVLLIRDKFTNRSKGFAYVEMSNLEDVPKVLLLNGQVPDFQIFPVMIKASEAEKNFAAKKDAVLLNDGLDGYGTGSFAKSSGDRSQSAASRIYCGNLHTNTTEDDLLAVFHSFGRILSVTINRDEMQRSKGYGFIQFSTPNEANTALSQGYGIEIQGNTLKLGPVNENGGVQRIIGMSNPSFHNDPDGVNNWKLEDEGLTMTSQSRAALMARLAGGKDMDLSSNFSQATANATATAAALAAGRNPNATPALGEELATALASEEIEGSPSFCFVIKNMFDVYEENKNSSPEWHLEIQQDVEEECQSYGNVLHCFVEREKQGGLVYVLFSKTAQAMEAAKKLHGRWFNKRQISVRYLSSQEYVGMFPETRAVVQSTRNNN